MTRLEDTPVLFSAFLAQFDSDWRQAARFYEPFRVRFEVAHAGARAARIPGGSKTATSSLPQEREARRVRARALAP